MDLFRVKDVHQKTFDWLEAQAENGHIWILGGIDESDIMYLLPLLEKAGKDGRGVTIHIDSCGGTTVIYEYVRSLCPSVERTIVYEMCESTALSIFALGRTRECLPHPLHAPPE